MDELLESFRKVHLASKPNAHVFVDSADDLNLIAMDLAAYDKVAFDAEGVDLGRKGALTVAAMQGFNQDNKDKFSPIYVIDVQVLGGNVVFSKKAEKPSIRSILEDPKIDKVTFDCRADSDALFHQFGVTLTGSIDLQVFDQAVRIHQGELPPQRERGGSWIPYVQNMERVGRRYSIVIDKSTAPHRKNFNVWKDRPLSDESIAYAAMDIDVIRRMWYAMSEAKVSDLLMSRTKTCSARYERLFREYPYEVSYESNKNLTMEEHPIIKKSELPAGHPRRPAETSSHRRMSRYGNRIFF
eukprot:scaffold2441_cov105-Cylindrotheca_fusiformis.AAC.8